MGTWVKRWIPFPALVEIWWSQAGSNRRPPACHAGALPAELWPHGWKARNSSDRARILQAWRGDKLRRRGREDGAIPRVRALDIALSALRYHLPIMRLPSLLLRIVLCLSLVLNGSGIAFASGHAGMDGHAMAGAGSEGQTDQPCHEDGTPDPAALMSHADHVPVAGGDVPLPDNTHTPGHAEKDCCDIGTCRCACMHGTVAAVAMLARVPVAAIRGTAVRPLVPAHPAPALPHLIRPPIG